MSFVYLFVAFVVTAMPLYMEVRLRQRFTEIYLRSNMRSLSIPTALCLLATTVLCWTDLQNNLLRLAVASIFAAFFVAHVASVKVGRPRWSHLLSYASSGILFLAMTYAYNITMYPLFVPALTMGLLFCRRLLKICNALYEASQEIGPLTEKIASLEATLRFNANTGTASQVLRDNPRKAS